MSYVEHCDKHGQYHADYICGDCVEELKKERDNFKATLVELINVVDESLLLDELLATDWDTLMKAVRKARKVLK